MVFPFGNSGYAEEAAKGSIAKTKLLIEVGPYNVAYLAGNCRAKSVAPQERAVPEEGQRTAMMLGSTRKIARRRRRRRREGGNVTHFGRSRPSFGRSRTVRSNL